MKYDFDKIVPRRGTNSTKWDSRAADILPMWVADMDFQSPPAVIQALRRRVDHGIYGYSFPPESCYQAITDWFRRRHDWEINREWITFSPGVVPGLNMLIRCLTRPGDKVIVRGPCTIRFLLP